MTGVNQYRRLGDYIHQVDIRNTNMSVMDLRGLSMTKEFRASTSNIVGVDLSKYKVVNQWTFAFDTMSVIRVHKVPIILNTEESPVIISPAYITFVVNDSTILDPLYLKMWVRRPEFDRYADFKSDAAVRGGYGWDELCDTMVKIPPIEEQHKIVAEYQAVDNRIAANEKLIAKLEDTAQTIYKKMFVDDIDPEHLPEGWTSCTLAAFGDIVTGKTPSSECPDDFGNKYPFLTPGDFTEGFKFLDKTERRLSEVGYSKLKSKSIDKGDLAITCIGYVGKVTVASGKCITNQQINSIKVKESYYSDYLYFYLKSIKTELMNAAVGSSTLPLLNKSDFEKISAVMPPKSLLLQFEQTSRPINEVTSLAEIENLKLFEILGLLLAKMSKS